MTVGLRIDGRSRGKICVTGFDFERSVPWALEPPLWTEMEERDMGLQGKGRIRRIDRRHRLPEGLSMKATPEILEVRRTPAASMMNITGQGVLSYQAAAGDTNFLEISLNLAGTDYIFEDIGAGVTIDASNVPGSVQITPNKVSVPANASVTALLVNVLDMNDTVTVMTDLAGRPVSIFGGAGNDTIDAIPVLSRTVLLGEDGNDMIFAGKGGSLILGGPGNDFLRGQIGNDSINGGEGDDRIEGGAGEDVLGEFEASPYLMPEIYGLLIYTGLDQPLDYVNQLVDFNRDEPSYVHIVGNNGIDPELYYGTGLDFDMSGNLYMTIQTDTNFFFKVDTATGAATLVGGSGLEAGYRVSDLSWDPIGNRMLGLVDFRANVPGPIPKPRLAQIDLTTGAVTFLGTLNIDDNQTVALSIDSAGNYYVLGLFSERWYKVDRSTLGVTPLATLPFYPNNWQQGATVDWARNDVLYYAAFEEINDTTFRNTLFTVDKTTGALTTVGYMGLNVNANGSTQYGDIAINPLSVQRYLEPGKDSILGGDGNDTIQSGTGDDSVEGGAGRDLILGQAGDDVLKGGDDHDVIFGGDGNDTIDGGNGDDFAYGEAGNDSILGGDGNDMLDGVDGDDTIRGDAGDDTIYGGAGADSLFGDAGDDHIEGNEGNDHIEGNGGADLICGDAGEDVIYGYSGNDTIMGGDGNDYVDGGTDDDLIAGGLGDDSIYGAAGVDTILGGLGNDLLNGGDDADLIFGEEGDDTVLGGNGNDLIYGGVGADLLYGGTLTTANTMHMPRNTTLASDGNDTILGGDGFDRVDGGNGDNLLDAGDDGIRETVLAGPGNDMMYNHNYSYNYSRKFSDRSALDGGINQDLCRGLLVQPELPPLPDDCEDFTAASIPIQYYTGQWLVHGRVLIEYPRVERVPGNRKGFTPPFRGAQARSGVRGPVRLAAVQKTAVPRKGKV